MKKAYKASEEQGFYSFSGVKFDDFSKIHNVYAALILKKSSNLARKCRKGIVQLVLNTFINGIFQESQNPQVSEIHH